MSQPPITLSRVDAQRLEALLEKVPASDVAMALEEELLRANLVAPQDVPDNLVTMNMRARL